MSSNVDGSKAAKTVIRRLRASAIFWFVIAGFQILIGLPLVLVGYGVSMIICGGWNIHASITRLKTAKSMEENPLSIYPYFSSDSFQNYTLIFLLINLFFGGIIGVSASCYDLVLRHYVIKHEDELTIGLYPGEIYGDV